MQLRHSPVALCLSDKQRRNTVVPQCLFQRLLFSKHSSLNAIILLHVGWILAPLDERSWINLLPKMAFYPKNQLRFSVDNRNGRHFANLGSGQVQSQTAALYHRISEQSKIAFNYKNQFKVHVNNRDLVSETIYYNIFQESG